MKNPARKSLRLFASRDDFALFMKLGLFCVVVALWHATVRTSWFLDTRAPLQEMLLEAVVVGAPFVLLFHASSLHQVKSLQTLTDRAYHDPLARTLNRQTFVNRLSRRLRSADSGAIVLFDADHLNSINDRFGHAVGDRCIEAIEHRLKWNLRDSDWIGRMGGEEFAVFLSDVTKAQAVAIAERIGAPVSFTDKESQLHLTVSLSAGLTFANARRGVAGHLKEADEALYLAKLAGRARLCIFGSDEEVLLSKSGFTSVGNFSKGQQIGCTKPSIRLISR